MNIIFNLKELLLYLLIGLVQGLVEPLPISSSGHMVIFEYIFKITFSDLNFKIFVNLASFLAITFYYRKFIKEIIKDFFSYIFNKNKRKETKEKFMYVIFVIIACIPSGIVGILFKDYIEKYLSSILTVALSLLFTSIILFILSKLTKNNKNAEKLNAKKSISIGLSQIIGLIPGISRSGITTFMGVNKKLSLEEALKFSFIMYLPTSIGATFLSLISDNSIIESFNYLYIVSFISSFIGTYLGISLFFKSIKKNNFKFFAIYLLIISTIILFII